MKKQILKSFVAGCLFLTASVASAAEDIVQTAVTAGQFKTLAAALQAADLVDALQGEGPFTVFAPTDEAFAKVPEETLNELLKPENKAQLAAVLTYHVVPGKVTSKEVVKVSGAKSLNSQRIDVRVEDDAVFVDDARVVKTDIECTNGVIHVIDSVILPESKNLVEVADSAGAFKTLIAAAKAAGLAEALTGDDALTVFAPTDEAFAKLPEGTVESLLKPENKDKLTAVLKYHVVSGRVYSEDALAAKEAETLQGQDVKILASDKGAFVNDAMLLKTDVDASNGVIHVIDSVLLPSADENAAITPREMIRRAIAKGAPLYNAGHADACATVYMEAAHEMLTLEGDLPHGAVKALQTALHHSKSTHCSDSRAWTMRRGLDTAARLMAQLH